MEPTKTKLTPKDFFLQLGIIVSLYVSVISLINLLFQTINYAFPDKLAYYGDPYSGGIRVAIASLIIIFPLYLAFSWYIEKLFQTAPEKRDLGVRRWLLYFTLFVAGIAIIVDLVTLINAFLGGELTTRFVLKTITVLIVAGGVFGYYLSDLRRAQSTPSKNKPWSISAIVIVLASMIWGFSIMGSPATARAKRFDENRIADLQNIQWQIVNYWQQKGKFPKALADLEDPISGFRVPVDPDNKEAYEFTLGEGYAFKLCGNFSRSNIGEKERLAGRGEFSSPYPSAAIVADKSGRVESWEHEEGRYCFERVLDPELYPVRTKNP